MTAEALNGMDALENTLFVALLNLTNMSGDIRTGAAFWQYAHMVA